MKNGEAYRCSIHQQILDLLEKAHLGNDEHTILNKLDCRMLNGNVFFFFFFFQYSFRTFYLNRKSLGRNT